MKLIKPHYLPIILISLITSVTTISIFIYGTYRIASSGSVSWVDFMKFDNLDIDDESVCRNYLRGRQFISDNGRALEFDYQVIGYVTYKGSNKTICAGYFEIGEIMRYDENKQSEYRKIKLDNNFAGRSSLSFELERDGTMREFGGGRYYPVR